VDLTQFVYTFMALVLGISGLVLLVPSIRGLQSVVYRRGVAALGASTILFVFGWVSNYVIYYFLPTRELLYELSWLVILASAVFHLYAVWLFARDFVTLETQDRFEVTAGEHGGGFENE